MTKKIIIEDGEFDCTKIIQKAINEGVEEIILKGLHGVTGSITIPKNVRIRSEKSKKGRKAELRLIR